MGRTEAMLNCCAITQDLDVEHWLWNDAEKQYLLSKDIYAVGMNIVCRLQDFGCVIDEAYIIKHDKDTRKVWDDIKNEYVIDYKLEHIHLTIKFKKDKGATITQIANTVGLEKQYVEKAGRGKYGYDNLISYHTHIKYPEKHQYDVSDVITLVGRDYKSVYMERVDEWLKGRSKVKSEKAKLDVDWLEDKILSGEVTRQQILLTDEYFNIYSKNKRRLVDAFDTYGERRTAQTIQKLENGEYKMTVFFIVGNEGTGKTTLAKSLCQSLKEYSKETFSESWRVYSTAASNSVDDYCGEEIMLMDDLRGASMTASDWLKLLDPYNISPSSARYHNKTTACRVIIITSTKEPVDFFYYCKSVGGGERSELLDQFLRRIEALVRVIRTDNKNLVVDDNNDVCNVSIARTRRGDYRSVRIADSCDVVSVANNFDFSTYYSVDDSIKELVRIVSINNIIDKSERERMIALDNEIVTECVDEIVEEIVEEQKKEIDKKHSFDSGTISKLECDNDFDIFDSMSDPYLRDYMKQLWAKKIEIENKRKENVSE